MNGIALAAGCSLPVELAGRRTAVFGISGGGKSNTATVVIEQLLHAGEQVVLIDPKGEGWGLLSTAAGKPSNLPIIVFGEPNGHIETLADTHGPRLADFVVETGRSVVLSLLGFESDQSERRFVASFLRQLYRRKSRHGQPTRTLVVLEEAHLFVPEHVRGDAAELAGAVQRIARQGRTFGLGTLLVDQRPQDVSKRVVSQCDTLICHQLVHKTDRDALREWVRGYDVDGRGEQFLESLASLEPGEAWVWSPAWLKVFKRVKVSRRKTFDSGAAPDGSSASRAVQRADVDLDQLRGQLAEIVDKAKADDPKELKRKLAELTKQLQQRPAAPAPPIVERVEVRVPVLENGQLEAAHGLVDRMREMGQALLEKTDLLTQTIGAAIRKPAPVMHQKAAPIQTTAPVIREKAAPIHPPSQPSGKANSGLRRMLIALAQRPQGLSARQLGVRAGLSASSGTFGTYLGQCRSQGWIEGERARLRITAAGLESLGEYEPLPTGQALLAYWLGELGSSGVARMLQTLAEVYPASMTAESLGETAGISSSSGTFGTYLGKLRSLELVEGGRQALRASDELFS